MRSSRTLVVLVVLVVPALLGLCDSACGPRDDLPGVRRDAPRPAATRSQRPAETHATKLPAGRPRIVVLGDSLTAGLGLAPDEAYPADLQRRLNEKGLLYDVVNAGVSGDTSAGVTAAAPGCVSQ